MLLARNYLRWWYEEEACSSSSKMVKLIHTTQIQEKFEAWPSCYLEGGEEGRDGRKGGMGGKDGREGSMGEREGGREGGIK